MKKRILASCMALALFPGISSAFLSYENQDAVSPDVEARIKALESKIDARIEPATPVSAPAPVVSAVSADREDITIRPSACAGRVEVIGQPKRKPTIIMSSGKNRPIIDALTGVVPKNWTVTDQFGGDRKVSWRKKKAIWPEFVKTIAQSSRLCVTLNWDAQVVALSSGYTVSTQSTTSGAAAEPQAIPPVAEVAKPDVAEFTLEPDRTLREMLEEWGKKAGWDVVWNVRNMDYPITHRAGLGSDFLNALDQVMGAYENAENPIMAKVYNVNRVVEIVDYTGFDRNTVRSRLVQSQQPANSNE